jgi:LacI family transcriptional regulator
MSVRSINKRVRIKDVAEQAGVSTATVSHVINQTRFVTEPTRQRVLRAIENCNYYPNAHARSLASGRSHTIGLLVSDISNPFFPELVKSIEVAASDRGYDIILASSNYDARRTSDYVRRMIGRQVAGVLLMTSEVDQDLIEELIDSEVPVVFYNLEPTATRINNVIVDCEVGIEEALSHLVSLGHRQIAHLAGPQATRAGSQRLAAFQHCVAKYLPGSQALICEGDFRVEGGRRAASELLARAALPTAVIAANDMMALGLMKEFRSAGLAIPRDISVIGFDDIAFAALSDPPLSTVSLPRIELGRRVVEALMMTIDPPGAGGFEFHVSTHLLVRGSTAPCRPQAAKQIQ